MASDQHVLLAANGASALNSYRDAHPGTQLDLSGADLRGRNLEHANLSNCSLVNCILDDANLASANLTEARLDNAQLQGANLRGAKLITSNLDGANLLHADLSDADCSGARFSEAEFGGVLVTRKTVFKDAVMDRAKVTAEVLAHCNIAGAHLRGLDISGADFSGQELTGTDFSGSAFRSCNFSNSNLSRASFRNCKLEQTCFKAANLSNADLMFADLTDAVLIDAQLRQAQLNEAILNHAKVAGADFFEASLKFNSMEGLVGVFYARNLLTTRIDLEVQYFPTVVRSLPERWVDWERIRVFGRLPLFGASYTGLILIPLYVYLLDIYNQKIEAMRVWIGRSADGSTAAAVLPHLHREPIPDRFSVLFWSTIFLAIASTMYALLCPSRVKEFSRDQWRYQLGHSLVHYWPEAWKYRPARLLCASLYLAGGLGVIYVFFFKLLGVAYILYRS
jgi:uncharacterized protein YjbI with pentapeptide repeats